MVALVLMQFERALWAMKKEHDLVEANALIDEIEVKFSVVNEMMHDAEAKFAEVDRKNVEVDRKNAELDKKLRGLKAYESVMQKERFEYALYQHLSMFLCCHLMPSFFIACM